MFFLFDVHKRRRRRRNNILSNKKMTSPMWETDSFSRGGDGGISFSPRRAIPFIIVSIHQLLMNDDPPIADPAIYYPFGLLFLREKIIILFYLRKKCLFLPDSFVAVVVVWEKKKKKWNLLCVSSWAAMAVTTFQFDVCPLWNIQKEGEEEETEVEKKKKKKATGDITREEVWRRRSECALADWMAGSRALLCPLHSVCFST